MRFSENNNLIERTIKMATKKITTEPMLVRNFNKETNKYEITKKWKTTITYLTENNEYTKRVIISDTCW